MSAAEIITWDGSPVTKPGLYDMPAAAYFGDVLPAGLSQSSAKVLLEDGGPARFKAALAPLADEAAKWATDCERQSEALFERGDHTAGLRAVTAKNVHDSYAKRLRAISEGKS